MTLKTVLFSFCLLTTCIPVQREKSVQEYSTDAIMIIAERYEIREDETAAVTCVKLLNDGTRQIIPDSLVVYSINNPDIIKISEGRIHGVRCGYSTVTAFTEDLSCIENISVIPRNHYEDIVICEVLYDPEGTDSGREFIELYNTGEYPCDLTGCSVSDGAKSSAACALSGIIAPQEFFCIAQNRLDFQNTYGKTPDEGPFSFSLNNTGETVFLRAPDGSTIDSVFIKNGTTDYPTPDSWDSTTLSAAEGLSLNRDLDIKPGAAAWFQSEPSPFK